jgi:hypothetical protein
MDNEITRGGDVAWIYLAQNRDMSRAVVNTVMKRGVPYDGENFFHYLRKHQLLKKDSAPWSYSLIHFSFSKKVLENS